MLPVRVCGQGTAVTCALSGPDSIRFVEGAFVPDRFYLDVVLHNGGADDVANVTVYLLQSRRFTLLSAQPRTVDTIRAGASVELRGDAGFHLQVKGGELSGLDTLQLFVEISGMRTSCMLPIYVEKDTKPRLELECEKPAALNFDPRLNAYFPDPFPVRTTLRNTGDGNANACMLSYAGASRVVPADGEYNMNVGRLAPGEEFTFTWQMRPARRDNGGIEPLPFHADGFGGMGNRFISTECATQVYVPASRAADYLCALDVDTVHYDTSGRRYSPDPFTIRARVTNVGQGVALGMVMHTFLDDGLVLAPGQSHIDTLHRSLGPGESSGIYQKSVRPIWKRTGDSMHVTVLFVDRFGNSARCEASIWIPPAEKPFVRLQCRSDFDSLVADPEQGGYRQSQFVFHAGIQNLSPEPIYNVSLFAMAEPEGILLIDPATQEQPIATGLQDSDGMRQTSWVVRAAPSTTDRTVRLRVFSIARGPSGFHLPLLSCEVPVFVPRAGQALLQCAIVTDVTDGDKDMTVTFDTLHADYEGIPSRMGDYSVFRVTMEVTNTGDAAAPFVAAVLLPPPGLRLEEGESYTKTVIPPRLAVGERGIASWLLQPLPVARDTTYMIDALVSTEQVDPSGCGITLTVEEALEIVEVSMPTDLMGVSGGMLEVPVFIGSAPGNDPGAYQLLIRYDPTLLRFVRARNDGSITAYSWRNLTTRILAEAPASGMNILVVADSTHSTPRESPVGSLLVTLFFEVLHQGVDLHDPRYIVQSPLEFVRYPSVMEDGARRGPFIRPFDRTRKLTPVFRDGEATLSGDCLLPLSASTRLLPNQPNPFNPLTTIRYHLAEQTPYRIILLDSFGRPLRLIDEGRKSPGTYSVLLDAGDLPSGMYFCRLETPRHAQVRKLLLMK